ncbi:hypothetical protein ACOMHN_059173 [Nucella lapillus]
MRITVKVVNGEEFPLAVSASSEVGEVKELIHTLMSIPTAEQKLMHQGTVLLDEHFLKDYEIQHGSTLLLTVNDVPKCPRERDHPSQNTSDDSNASLQRPLPHVWETLLTFLKRHFTEKDAEVVLVEFQKNFEQDLAQMSLDEIERFASTKLGRTQQ